ncbi:MAG: polysaccharide deacetylase family protein, partial [Acidobacteria bacterium]|nr:polysaccharide deacetylase family protein [Acidobacteriota bacterium]
VILVYHSIDRARFSGEGSQYYVTPEDFDRQMEFLVSRRTMVTAGEILDRLRRGGELQGLVAVTFDDGYYNNLQNALPVLKKYKLPATLFLTTEGLDQHPRWDSSGNYFGERLLSWEEAAALRGAGIEVGCHSHSHYDLTGISLNAAVSDLRRSRDVLASRISGPLLLSYPHGKYTDALIREVEVLGFAGACGIQKGFVNAGTSPWALKRIHVFGHDDFSSFRRKLFWVPLYYEIGRRLKYFFAGHCRPSAGSRG